MQSSLFIISGGKEESFLYFMKSLIILIVKTLPWMSQSVHFYKMFFDWYILYLDVRTNLVTHYKTLGRHIICTF